MITIEFQNSDKVNVNSEEVNNKDSDVSILSLPYKYLQYYMSSSKSLITFPHRCTDRNN